jgi:hypothetical protein
MKNKEIQHRVNALLDSGMTKAAVFEQLKQAGAKEKRLAYMIGAHIDPARISKNEIHIRIIIIINVLLMLLSFFIGFFIDPNFSLGGKFFVGTLCALIPAAFVYGFGKHNVGAYNAFILLSIMGLHRVFSGFHEDPQATLIALGINILIIGYVWFVRNRLFPDFHSFSPRKVKGNYVFTEIEAPKNPAANYPFL